MIERLEAVLRRHASELGFSLVGITHPQESGHSAFYRAWLERGAQGEMAYLARPDAVARRADLKRTMSSVRSVVVVAHEYFTEEPAGLADDPSRGVIARYARGRDYHKVVKKKLLRLLERVRGEANRPVEGYAYVDTGPLLERELASRAGLGWFGKNTMLISPRRGSWFFLGCLLLDVELEADPPFSADHCGTCNRCVEACPTGALLGRDERGAPVIDARRCISYLTTEHKGAIPLELRPLMGNHVLGCDICQEVCPFNAPKFVQSTPEPDYRPEWHACVNEADAQATPMSTEAPSLVALLRMTRGQWDRWTRGSAVRRAGFAGLRRNAAIALGNWLAATYATHSLSPRLLVDDRVAAFEQDLRTLLLCLGQRSEHHCDVVAACCADILRHPGERLRCRTRSFGHKGQRKC